MIRQQMKMCQLSQANRRTLLSHLEVAELPITKAWLENQWVHGYNGWDLSEKLETFVCCWVNDTIYGQRVQLAGGKSETGNGFEIWRQLFHEHHGGADAI